MHKTILSILTAVGLCVAVLGTPALALDLEKARAGAAVLENALERGRKGDWDAAEAAARKTADVLVHDIVLWRKLRAGKGTVREYQSFVSRRGTFPGMDVLAEVVLGRRPGPYVPPKDLKGKPKQRWNALSKLWMADKFDAAEKLIADYSGSAEMLGIPERWADRRTRLARRAMREGRGKLAYKIASNHFTTPEAGYVHADLEWLSGWIALQALDKPDTAIGHFNRFLDAVETPISLARGGYWLGRAYEAKGKKKDARRAYTQAAQYQTAFYGQLAAEKVGASPQQALATAKLPNPASVPEMRSDDVRAMVMLELAGEEGLAAQMFFHKAKLLDDPMALAGLGKVALDLGRPHYAVRVSKIAARKGIVVPGAYYPLHELANYVNRVEPAFAMAIARQETELNPEAISRAGARGLMQVMPATAEKVASDIGEPYSKIRLTEDWRYNARLGQSYLAEQVRRFDGSYFLAAAAYNAGPHRVKTWLEEYGDPRSGSGDVEKIVDWIENIPFSETRNYVQRVTEALWTYRARLAGRAGPMTLSEDLTRGVAS